MKEFLSQKGVQYKELNIATDDQAKNEMLQKTGKLAVPTIMVGDTAVVGFDRGKLEKLLS
ncbi:MAG: glutaredoxin domain-containing protein [Desulfotomaculaceae bacterium]|nr:glutaredoxin domain-containing protein [Desulfotomaculaceae bacterium]